MGKEKSLQERIIEHENRAYFNMAMALKLRGEIENLREFAVRQAPVVQMILEGALEANDVKWSEIRKTIKGMALDVSEIID
jgi:hypothetical protein